MKQATRALLTLAVVLAFITTLTLNSFGQNAQPFLTRHVPDVVATGKAQLVGHLPADQVMRFDIVIPLRDQAGLDQFLQDLYNPSSPFYHLFITPPEFTERFGPTQDDWDALVALAKASGFQVFSGSREERDLRLTGTVAAIEKTFHVTMNSYQHPTENRTFYSMDREPTVNMAFPLWHVSGLDNYIKKHSMLESRQDYAKKHGIKPEDVVSHATTGSGPSASFLGTDMRHAYYCNGTCSGGALTGTGQTVGLFEYYGTDLSDLTLYYHNVSQTEPFTPTIISTDGSSTTSSNDTEQTLDMTQAMGMAPGLTMVYMYVGNTDTAIIGAMVSNTDAPISKQIGCSWGWTADVSTLNPYFQQMGTQDQNFFAASGDSGYWHGTGNAAPWPADDAYIVGVGGTDLTTTGAAGPWATETGWVDSGGGITTNSIPIPSWQQLTGVINSSNAGSTTLRNGPDVSANANFTFYVCGGGSCSANSEGGTSFAAPMWAGYLALANQQAATYGESIGFLNPIIYPANLTANYSTYFHDVVGNSNGKYSAVTGFDLLSGWGSPNGAGLINLLAPQSGTTPQTITVTTAPPASAAYNSSFGVAATASSGLAVAITTSGSCTGSGTSSATITMSSGTGTCSVIFNQAGNATYATAPTVTDTTNATTASQTISWTAAPPASAAYYSTFNATATATSGLAVTIAGSGECSGSGSAGSATITMNATSGTCTVTASQAGNTNYSAATSLTPTVSATQATQTITFTTNPPSSEVYNGHFTVAATASSSLAVTYTSSGVCTNSGATYTMTSGTGSCSVIANQSGNTYYAAAAQVTKTVTASLASQTITFTTNAPSSSAYNSNFTVAATASSGLAVAFTSSGSCTNVGTTYTMTSGTGSCSVIANQAGNSNYAAATQVTQTVTATKLSQTITFTTAAPSSAEYGSSFTVAATATSGLSVAFTASGSCTNSGATYTMTSSSGTCSVIANQAGNTNYSAASQVTETTSATDANGSVAVASNLNPSTAGQSVTFTATITSDTGLVKGRVTKRPKVVSGSVTWSSNTGCGTTSVTPGYPGTATCTTSSLGVGTDTITATYSGDSNHNGGTGTLSGGQVVNSAQSATSTSVGSSLDPTVYGQAVSFTATVSSGGGTPAGTVQFVIDGTNFGSPVTLSGGAAASGSTSTLAVGTHTVTAAYSGNSSFQSSSGTLSGGQVVNTATAGTVVTSSVNPSAYGQSVTFTATINGEYGLVKGRATRKPRDVTGTVAWSSNTGCGTTNVTSGNPGTATCTTSSLGVGSDTVTGTYSGDANHSGSAGSLGQTVNQAANTVTFTTPAPASAEYGSSFTVAASGLGTGAISYTSGGACSNSGAAYTMTAGSGTCTVTATQAADTNYQSGSASASVTAEPAQGSVSVSLTSGTNPSTYGNSVTFTATVTSDTGAVKGRTAKRPRDLNGSVAWSANTGCSASPVSGNPPQTVTCTTSTLGVGGDTVTATYTASDSNHTTASGSVSQTVNQASQSITFTTAAPASAVYNSNFTVAASASSGLAVAYTSAGACSNSGATYTMTSGSGTCFVIANQAGNANYSAASQVTESTNATLASQTITVTTGAPATAAYHSSFTVAASAQTAIAYSSSGACSNSGATYTITASSGTCTVIMNAPANSNYAAAPTVTQHTTVQAAVAPSVSFTGAPATAVYGSSFTVTASSNSSSVPTITAPATAACTVGGVSNSGPGSYQATVTMIKGSGMCALTAKWAANYAYTAGSATQKTTAKKIVPTVSFTGAPTSASNGTQFTVTATSNESGTYAVTPTITAPAAGPCTVGSVSGSGPSYTATVTITKASGTCKLTAKWAASTAYDAASAIQSTTATN